MSVILNEKQKLGLQIAVNRYNSGEKYTVIAGYAGTGKTELVKFIISALGLSEDEVCYTAYTGKATEVLSKRGNPNPSTLHHLLYKTTMLPDGSYVHRPVKAIPFSLVVVDEVSMVPKSLMELLLGYDCHVLALGDPFQLPPVYKNEDNGLLEHPHIFLDEIMRQDDTSSIIDLSMKIRNGDYIGYGQFGEDVLVLPAHTINQSHLLWADQVLVGTNKMRKEYNKDMRAALGFDVGNPLNVGEKIICCKNYWENFSDKDSPLINGLIGRVEVAFENSIYYPREIYQDSKLDYIQTKFVTDTNERYIASIDKSFLTTGEEALEPRGKYIASKRGFLIPNNFEYGYAITGHKSQGSEWDKVFVREESFPFSREEHARWLYTCATRASKKLVIAK